MLHKESTYIFWVQIPNLKYFMQLKLFTNILQIPLPCQWNKSTSSQEIIGSGAKQGQLHCLPRTIYCKLEYNASIRVQREGE